MNMIGAISFAVVMLALGVLLMVRPDLMQSYSVWSLDVGIKAPESTRRFVRSKQYLTFLRVVGVVPLAAGLFAMWMVFKQVLI